MIEVYCSKCGKMFIPAPQHIYKDHKGIYCSWTCFNHRNDGELIQHSRPRIYKVEQYSLDGELIAVFQSSTEAAEYINGTANALRIACRSKTPYKGFMWRYQT